jgi:hypothetical protein
MRLCRCFMLISALVRGVTQRRVVILYRRLGTTYRSHLQGSRSPRRVGFLTIEDGTDTLSRNVGKGLPLDAALYPRRAQISSASRRKPQITGFMLGVWSPTGTWVANPQPVAVYLSDTCDFDCLLLGVRDSYDHLLLSSCLICFLEACGMAFVLQIPFVWLCLALRI